MPPTISAPTSANSGAYGDREPSSSSSGPSREPRNAPAAKPTSDSAPTISPWAYPQSAISTVNTTMIQSRAVTRRSQGSTPGGDSALLPSPERRRRLTHRALPGPRRAGRAGRWRPGWLVGAGAPSAAERTARGLHRGMGARGLPRRCTRCSTTRRGAPTRCASSGAPTATPRPPPPPTASTPGDPAGEQRRRGGACRSTCARGSSAACAASWGCRSSDERRDLGPAARLPGLRRGEALTRRSEPPERGHAAVARPQGAGRGPADARSSPLGGDRRLDRRHAGARGDPRRSARALYARGFPRDWPVGQNGLEEAFEHRARRPAGRRAAGRASACSPAPAPRPRRRCAPRSTRACRRRP